MRRRGPSRPVSQTPVPRVRGPSGRSRGPEATSRPKSAAYARKLTMFDGRGAGSAALEETRHALGDRPHATRREEVEGVLRVHQHDHSRPALGHEHGVGVEVEGLALVVDRGDPVERPDEPAHRVGRAGLRGRDGGSVQLVHSRGRKHRGVAGSGRRSGARAGSASCPRRWRSGTRPGRARGCRGARRLSACRTSSGSRLQGRAARLPPRR